MKIEIADLSGLPDGLNAVVETDGDKTVLDLSKLMAKEDLSGLKSALGKERANADAWKGLGSPDEVRARIADLEAAVNKGGKVSEDAQAKMDQMKSEFEAKEADLMGRFQGLARNTVTAELKAELAKAGFVSEAIDDVAGSALQRIKFGEDGAAVVLTPTGEPMIGGGANHSATLAELSAELAQAKPYAVRNAGKSGGGKPAGSTGGTPSMKRSEMTPTQKSAFVAEHGQEAFLKLPK